MTIQNFQIQGQRTLANLGSKLADSIHMTLGFSSEISRELMEAIRNKDIVNIAEELIDAQYFLTGYCTVHGIVLPKGPIFYQGHENSVTDDMWDCMGRLQDMDKAEHAYGKVTPSNDPERIHCVITLIGITEHIGKFWFNINMDNARHKVIEKLKYRHPEKFDIERAINRNTRKERKILETA